MTTLTFHRLSPSSANDRAQWRQMFRGAPGFVYATDGRVPMDEDADRMIDTLPNGKQADDVFIYSILANGELCGSAWDSRSSGGRGWRG